MKHLLIVFALLMFLACKNDKTATNVSENKLDLKNLVITPELVDSLKKNRIDKLTQLRKTVGRVCEQISKGGYVYFKIKVDSNGAYSEISVPNQEDENTRIFVDCIEKYIVDNNFDFGIIREMPDSKYGAIPRIKSYTLRVY
ncbi:MAG: hypothetical protein HKN51_12205 [Saprospiraceae bacterium]|nr:hypothetical protein [Saprospiraceae bacterium]